MAKAITEVAIGAAAIGAAVLVPGAGIAAAAAFLHTTSAAVIGGLVSIGSSEVMAGLSAALQRNQGGLAVGVTTPIGPWSYVYGMQKVGGIEIFRQSNNNTGGGGSTSNNKQLHRVYALACHPCKIGNWQLRIDGKQVPVTLSGAGYASYSPAQVTKSIVSISRSSGLVTMILDSGIANADGTTLQVKNVNDRTFNGNVIVTQPDPSDNTKFTFVNGGVDTVSSGGSAVTTYSDYKDKIYVEFLNGSHTATFSKLASAGTIWGATDKGLGRTLVYVQMGYDDGVFPSSIPNVSFVIEGKNDILDPRTGTRGYTNNAALCIADYMCIPVEQGGFGLAIGDDIPEDTLIAAANICDEDVPLAAGGTQKRYTCNTFIQLNSTRGSILANMLTSCGGELSYQGGQFNIFPAAWVAPTLELGDNDLAGGIKVQPRLSIRDACNAVKGTYVSPENGYQQADVPAYMQDAEHGYASDPWLAEDNGERLFQEANFPCTDNAATAQRLMKIALLRKRHQIRFSAQYKMVAYRAVALDVVNVTHRRYGWVSKPFKVRSSGLTVDKSGDLPRPVVNLDFVETDPSIFDWSTTEELTPQGYKQPSNIGANVVSPPEGMVLYSGPGTTTGGITYPSTIATGADGVARNSMYVLWNAPNDAFVTSGGEIQIQYQPTGAPGWLDFGKVHGATESCFILGVSDGASYNVRIRAINTSGYTSDWVVAGPHIQSSTTSIFTTSSGFNGLGWTATQLIVINYTVTNSGVTFSWAAQTMQFADGSTLAIPAGSASYTGLAASTKYYTYWYANAVTGVLARTNSSPPPTTPSSLLAAQCSLNGRIAIPVISFTTLAASNPGSGGGTGGGGDTCPEAEELVETQERGVIRAGDVRIGDALKGRCFANSEDVFRKVIAARAVESSSWRIISGHRVSPCEPVYDDGRWVPAYKAAGAVVDVKPGTKIMISLESDEYDEQNYYLTGETPLLIHNVGLPANPC